MNADIHLMIEALESYTGLPWDYLKIAHPSIEKLFKRCAGTISRDDLIEISKTICDRCTMADKLCEAIMEQASTEPEKHTDERTETHACDCIGRQAAIDAADRADYTGLAIEDVKKVTDEVVKEIKKLPSAQPTLYGYNIEHLKLIANVLQKENLPPERVAEALNDISRIVEIVSAEFAETLRKAVEQCKI